MTTYTNQHQQREPTLGELFSNLSAKTSLLVRKEVELAKVEMRQKAAKAGRQVTLLAVAGALGYAALLLLLAGLVLLLGLWIPVWVAALIVGVILAIVSGGLAWTGVQALKEMDPMPRQTIETLQEDKEWLSAQMN
jgi:uncharacterized membrane protein YqjE